MNVIVIRFSSLGDCVLLCPFLEHLKRCGADQVTVVTKRNYAELFAAARGVDRVVALQTGAGWRGIGQIVRALKDPPAVVIDAHASLRSRMVSAGLGGAQARYRKFYTERLGLIMFKRPADTPTVRENYSALGEQLGLPPVTAVAGGIDVPGAARRRVALRLAGIAKPCVAIAPGSRWSTKRWGEAKFMEIARRIVADHGYHVVLLGDERDAAITSPIAEALGSNATDLAGATSIVESAAVIERCSAFIGNDSGLTHLAEAVGVPVIALFGPTVEAFGYFPSLPRSRVIERNISCRPCSRNGSRPCWKGTQECLAGIDVDPVEEAFKELVEDVAVTAADQPHP